MPSIYRNLLTAIAAWAYSFPAAAAGPLAGCELAGETLACTLGAGDGAAPPVVDDTGLKLALDLAAPAGSADVLQALDGLRAEYDRAVDWPSGLRLRGRGESAAAALALGAGLPDEWWHTMTAAVQAEDPPAGALADFERAAASGGIDHIYFRLEGAAGFDPDYLRTCERERIACFGTWGTGVATGELFTDPAQELRFGMPLPVFTGSTANRWGDRGHYNLGLSWNAGGIVSNAKGLVVPLRYRRDAGANQPQQAGFDLTLRKSRYLNRRKGERMSWVLAGGDQRGEAVVAADGSLHIEGLTLASTDRYTALMVAPPQAPWQLVYTRQPRAAAPVRGSPVQEAANWQHATDVGRINHAIAEADVVIDNLEGKVKVIHDCTGSKVICVAHEARVSPDGTKIVYSVGYGNTLVPVHAQGLNMNILEIPGLTHAELWIYDLTTGRKHKIPHRPPLAIDRQPDWLTNDKIVFVSNRGETYPFKNPFGLHQGVDQFGRGRCFSSPYCVSQEYGYGRAGMSMQLWTMNIDGTDAKNISPHEQNALAPAVMSNGDILYSCWNSHENKNFDAKSSHSNRPTTGKNKWWLCRTDSNGADATVILNGHKTTTLKTKEWLARSVQGGEGRSQLRAIRSVAEIFRDYLAVSNYYRSNHVGSMGIIYGMDYLDPHVEGCSTARCYPHGESNSSQPGSGRYVPSSLVAITPYGTDQDIKVRRDGRGRAMGKAGYAAPLPNTDSDFLITHARGSCYEVTLLQEANRRAMGGEPTCQKAIYRVKVPMVTDPFDTRQMELIAGGDAWQAWDARAIAPYRELLGQEAPAQLPSLDPDEQCYLEVVDAREAELHASAPRYDWLNNLYQQCAHQGCAVNTEDPDFHRRNIAALTVFLPEMWDITYGNGNEKEYQSILNNTGHKSVATLGSQPLEADGSVKMQVPCETPIIMAGTDKDGMVIAWDVMLHSLRAGETRTCHGCHDGHSEERAARIVGAARERFAQTLSAGTYPALPRAAKPVTFDDVRPILEKRCTGCHRDMNDDNGLLYSRVAQDFEQHDFAWARKHPGQGVRTNVEHVLIINGGRGYSVGDALVFQPGGAEGQVSEVGPRGEIRAIRMVRAGTGYAPFTPVTVRSAAGKGANLRAMTDRFDLSRPYTSKWVSRFARDSLLYWKCLGSRQDGRTDRQYPNDIDFGPAHDSGATPEECRTIGRWIDQGIQHTL